MTAPRCAVLVHVYYPELWGGIARYIARMDGVPFDLYVNAVDGRTSPGWRDRVCRRFPGARVFVSPNLGQDIGGTISLLNQVDLDRYDLVCKIHTKKSTYLPGAAGAQWRDDLLSACLADPKGVFEIFAARPNVTMLGSARHVAVGNGINQRQCERLCDRLKLDRRYVNSPWVAGSMFWCRPYVFQALKDAKITQDEFIFGYGHDGTLAHALERVFGALAASRGEIYWHTPCRSEQVRTNGSIIRHRGRLLLACRHGFPWSTLGICGLDEELNVLWDRELDVPVARGEEEALSDPRLVSCGGQLYCSYVYENDAGRGSTQLLCRLSDRLSIEENIAFPRLNGSSHEKNWTFFDYEGRLLFVYSIQPEHVIMDLKMNEVGRTPCVFPWPWGEPRGGTPPVRVGDEYVSFFHSHVKDRHGFSRCYAAGYYAFSAKPPFAVTRWSRRPILLPDYADAPHGCAAVFPAGAIFERTKWLVAYGYYDTWTHVLELRPDELDGRPSCRRQGKRVLWPRDALAPLSVATAAH